MLLENKCRTCYRDVTTDESYVLTPLQDDSQTLSNLASKLKECVPEIELGAMQEEKICWTCCVTLDKTYEFRVTCLQTNEKFVSINNLHTDIDLVKTEVEDAIDIKQENVDVLADDEPFEENEVIKGDISVGFEITKAKDVHNTVSVSITTSGTEIKTFNKTHSFPNPFSTESAKLIVSDAFVDKISDGVNEIQSKFKIDCVVDKAIDDAVDYDEQVKCDLRVQPLANQVSDALKQKRSVYICTFCDAIFATRIKWKKHTDLHKRKRQVSKHRHKNEPKTMLNTDRNSDQKPRLILKSETVTRSKSLGLAESRTRRKAVANTKPKSNLDDREIKRHNTRNANVKMFTNKTASNEPTPKAKTIAVNKTKRKSDPANKPKIKVEAIKPPDITCVFCKINFHSVNIYNIHMKFIHKNEVANVERINNVDLSCAKCGKVFESRQQLDAHVKSHVNRQPAVTPKYNCWFCGDDLYSQRGFAGHSARHRHHKKCKFCSKEFTHMTQYLQHQPCAKEKQIKTKGKVKEKTKSTVVSDVVKKNTRNNILESTLSTKSLKRKITTRSSKTKLVEDAPLNPPKRAKIEVNVLSKPKYNNHVVRTRSRSHKTEEFVLSSSNVETMTPAPEGAKLEILKPLDWEAHESKLVVDDSVRRDRKKSPIVSHFEEIESNKRRAQSKMDFVKVDEDPAKDTTLPCDVRESTDRNELPMSSHFEEIESNKRRTDVNKVNDVDPAKDTTLLLEARESTELDGGEAIANEECNLTLRPNSRNAEQQTSNAQSCSDEIEPKTDDTKTSTSSDLVTSKDHSESPNVADEHVTSDKRTVDNSECNSIEAVVKIAENVADVPKICQFCSLSFNTTACLKAHVCLGSGMELDQMYRCTICRTLFVGQEAFIGHTNSVHSGSFS